MPRFASNSVNEIASKSSTRSEFGTRTANPITVGGAHIAEIILNNETVNLRDSKDNDTEKEFPCMACLCGEPLEFRLTQAFGGRVSREHFTSCAPALLEAIAKNRTAWKIFICPKSGKPMSYVSDPTAGFWVAKCSYAGCECMPIPIADILVDPSTVTVLSDGFVNWIRDNGFTKLTKPTAEQHRDLMTYEEAVRSAGFFPATHSIIRDESKPSLASAKKGDKPRTAAIKEVSVKNATMAKKATTAGSKRAAAPAARPKILPAPITVIESPADDEVEEDDSSDNNEEEYDENASQD